MTESEEMPPLPLRFPLNAIISAEHQKVFSTLLDVNKERNFNAVLRVAGGWVRDAILHKHSNDIDIAIETPPGATEQISGRLFADAVAEYEASHGGARTRTVSTIRVNPAMSKHIETATVCVHDIPVEFCALRTDDYSEDSRIPQVRPATAQEDAYRRDFTVNALYYNLTTGDVEDFTTGMADLERRVLRCPLEPRTTFQDDPLRLLRGVRFVGQLGDLNFTLDETIPACVDATLLAMLLQKVSRERIGKEVTKMFSGARPEKCIDLLFSMHLLQDVLLVEVYMKAVPGKKKHTAEIDHVVALKDTAPEEAMTVLRQLNRTVVPCFSGVAVAEANEEEEPTMPFAMLEDEKLVAVLFTVLIPFFRCADDQAATEERVYAVTINSLKMPVTVHNAVRRMVDCYNALRRSELSIAELAPSDGVMSGPTKMKIVDALGPLNDKSVIPDAFKVVLLNYLVLECNPTVLESDCAQRIAMNMFAPLWEGLAEEPLLLAAFQFEPLVTGTEVRSLPGVKPKQVGEILLHTRREMILNPTITKDELLDSIKRTFLASA